MTREEKDLLLKDLCSRLPYGVKVQSYNYEENVETIETLQEIDSDGYISTLECDTLKNIYKPYLFPLSSMTEEQWKELRSTMTENSFGVLCYNLKSYDYFYKNHIDTRGLIPRGLAINATGLNIY